MRVFNIDISRKGISPVVQVTEYDAMSRFFTLVLRNGSSDYEPPENPTYSVWYKTNDSTGWYDTITLPDESTRPAVVADGNAFTIEIAEQATTSCGELALMINGDDGYQLTVSGIITRSDDIPGYDGAEVENYYNVYITRMQENAARAENAAATAIEYGATVEVDENAQQLIITHTDNTGDVETWVTEAEAWAVGQRDGVDVPSTDETYHNNAKWYAGEYTALAGEVTELKSALNVSSPTLSLTSGNYINYNGGISADNSFSYSDAVPVKKGDVIRLTATGYSTNVAMISRCDQNGVVTSVLVLSDSNSEKTYEYFNEIDGYVCFSFKHTVPYALTIIGDPYLGECAARQILTKNVPVKFRIGNITITNSGWSYSDSTTRVSTVEGYTIHLRPGDIVGLTSYNGYRYYLGWKKSNGTYGAKGWNTVDYVVIDEGDYVVLITAVPEATVSDVSDLADLFKYEIVEDANSLIKYVSEQDSALGTQIEALSNASIGLNNPLIIPQKARFAMHRGLSSEAPENTIPAFTLAGQRGAWAIETDIYETTDGEFVCFHDATVDRMTDGTGNIASMTYAQVQALTIDAGANIGEYPNLKIPKMIDYLRICKRYGCIAFIEIKAITNYDNMIGIVKNFGMEKSCVFLVGVESNIKSLRTYTNAPIAFLGYANSDNSAILSMLEKYTNCWADLYVSTITDTTYPYSAHEKNMPLITWTVDSSATAEEQFDIGVDVVTSNSITNLN